MDGKEEKKPAGQMKKGVQNYCAERKEEAWGHKEKLSTFKNN